MTGEEYRAPTGPGPRVRARRSAAATVRLPLGHLAEPERRSNGYKQYGVTHLVRLLRIERLVDLGPALPQIADLGELDDHPAGALRTLDADLAAVIDRLQRARAELRVVLEQAAPTDLAPVTRIDLSEADRSFVTVSGAPRGARFAGRTVGEALRDLYDSARLGVLQRTEALLGAGRTVPPSTPG